MPDPTTVKHCPRCYRAEEDMGTCGNFAMGCPRPAVIPEEQAVEVSCGPCRFHRIIPVGAIMHNKGRPDGSCVSDRCKATVLHPAAPIQATMPAPIGEQPKKVVAKPTKKG